MKGLSGKGKLRRNSDSVEKMRNDVSLTLDRKLSTDEKPQHNKCPIRKDI